MISRNTLARVREFRDHYLNHGWVSIPDFLDAPVADSTARSLEEEADWEVTTLKEGRPFVVSKAEWRALPAQVRIDFVKEIIGYAQVRGFQYFYESVRVLGPDVRPTGKFSSFLRGLSGRETIGFFQTVTGIDDGDYIDAQLTRYVAGHFLTQHCDTKLVDGRTRRVAYVLSLTRQWKPDWGGLLHLLDAGGGVKKTLSPRFNTINLFRIPTEHFVSQVSNYCPLARLSVTGWLSSPSK